MPRVAPSASVTAARTEISLAKVEGLHPLAHELGVETRCVRDVGHQPVHSPDVALDDVEQPLALFVAVRAYSIDSTAERSELSGFLISCATSAAKLSMAPIRAIKRARHA